MSATFIAVVGQSGVGKDSLIDYTRERLAEDQAHFVRRVVTREVNAASECHDILDRTSFARAVQMGAFVLHWEAHGLCYGLPRSLDDELARGKVVVANLSRAVIPLMLQLYPLALVVEVVAAPEIIAQRLSERGRESAETIEARLSRRVARHLPPSTVQIDNSGPLQVAAEQFLSLICDVIRQPVPFARQESG